MNPISNPCEKEFGRRTVVPTGVSGPEFQLEIAAQSSSRIFVELDWAAGRKLD